MLDDLTLKDVETRLLKLPGTKRVLAAELGTSSETLSRTLARLRDQKMITVSAGTITVVTAPSLRPNCAATSAKPGTPDILPVS